MISDCFRSEPIKDKIPGNYVCICPRDESREFEGLPCMSEANGMFGTEELTCAKCIYCQLKSNLKVDNNE